jgi:hypothetical protein
MARFGIPARLDISLGEAKREGGNHRGGPPQPSSYFWLPDFGARRSFPVNRTFSSRNSTAPCQAVDRLPQGLQQRQRYPREPRSEGEELEPLGERPTSLTAVGTVEYIEDAYLHAATPGCVPGPRF